MDIPGGHGRLDDDSAAHELPDRVHHVDVITPKAVDPANYERVTCAKHVEQALALGTLGERCACAADTLINDHLVDFEPGLLGLGALAGGGLFARGYAGVEDDHNAELRNADASRQPVSLGASNPHVTVMAMSHFDPLGHTSTGREARGDLSADILFAYELLICYRD
jgi:hypothetical protein